MIQARENSSTDPILKSINRRLNNAVALPVDGALDPVALAAALEVCCFA